MFGGGAASDGVATTCSAPLPSRVASLLVGESTHLRLPFSGDMTSALSVSAEAMMPASSGIVSSNSSCRLQRAPVSCLPLLLRPESRTMASLLPDFDIVVIKT